MDGEASVSPGASASQPELHVSLYPYVKEEHANQGVDALASGDALADTETESVDACAPVDASQGYVPIFPIRESHIENMHSSLEMRLPTGDASTDGGAGNFPGGLRPEDRAPAREARPHVQGQGVPCRKCGAPVVKRFWRGRQPIYCLTCARRPGVEPVRTCKRCGTVFTRLRPKGRAPVFCGDACMVKYHNDKNSELIAKRKAEALLRRSDYLRAQFEILVAFDQSADAAFEARGRCIAEAEAILHSLKISQGLRRG
jgi:hypothetical protein